MEIDLCRFLATRKLGHRPVDQRGIGIPSKIRKGIQNLKHESCDGFLPKSRTLGFNTLSMKAPDSEMRRWRGKEAKQLVRVCDG